MKYVKDNIIFLICLLLTFDIKCFNITTICNTICDEVGGTCIEETICKCNEPYTTLPNEGNYKLCNYPKKNKLIAAILELFIGFGIGHFYTERKINGYLKLMVYLLLCCIGCCAIAIGLRFTSENAEEYGNAAKFFFYIYYCVLNFMMAWQIFDFFLMIFGVYVDGNNIELN
jgi:hypothetical protein